MTEPVTALARLPERLPSIRVSRSAHFAQAKHTKKASCADWDNFVAWRTLHGCMPMPTTKSGRVTTCIQGIRRTPGTAEAQNPSLVTAELSWLVAACHQRPPETCSVRSPRAWLTRSGITKGSTWRQADRSVGHGTICQECAASSRGP